MEDLEEGEIYDCQCILDGSLEVLNLVLIEGRPHLVLRWEEAPPGHKPLVVIPLSRAHLKPLRGHKDVDYIYEEPLSLPRRPQA